jgi:hypothetical protein
MNSTTIMATPSQRPSKPAPGPHAPSGNILSEVQQNEAICRRAREIYEHSGRIPGRDLQNWAQAEAEIRSETAALPAHRPSVVIKVEGVQYVGEYDSALAAGYTPGEFCAGDPVRVHFDSGKMYVYRANGQQLETTIVSRIG